MTFRCVELCQVYFHVHRTHLISGSGSHGTSVNSICTWETLWLWYFRLTLIFSNPQLGNCSSNRASYKIRVEFKIV
jgi:hypothetical protein